MSSGPSGWGVRPSQRPDAGQEYRADGTLLDVAKWREDQVVERNGQKNVRSYDAVNNAILQDMLEELKALHKTIKQIHNIEV